MSGRICSVPHGTMIRDVFIGDMFAQIEAAHTFRPLTESNKDGQAYRTGVYITPVFRVDEGVRFHLLRCSTNFRDGPTENVRDIDVAILEQVNAWRRKLSKFNGTAELNHVLAQIYHNVPGPDAKVHKAKISAHSDKTKDMPPNAVFAFCTFYNFVVNPDQHFCHKGVTTLSTLRFRRKLDAPHVASDGTPYQTQFDIVLWPNSVFFMTLDLNRFYTHEIVPSPLPAEMLPVRMGYVVRTSDTRALHKDDQTYIVDANQELHPLQHPTEADVAQLKDLYRQENRTSERIVYPDIYCSLNEGDYLAPIE